MVDTVTEAVSSVLHLGQHAPHESHLKQPSALEGGLPLKTMARGEAGGQGGGQGGGRVDVPPRAGQDMPAMAAAFAGQPGGEGLSEGGPGGSAGWRHGGKVEGERLLVREGAGGPEYSAGGGAREPAGSGMAGKVLRKEGEGVGGTAIKEGRQGATAAPAGWEESVG
jgi:hypothetical protein